MIGILMRRRMQWFARPILWCAWARPACACTRRSKATSCLSLSVQRM